MDKYHSEKRTKNLLNLCQFKIERDSIDWQLKTSATLLTKITLFNKPLRGEGAVVGPKHDENTKKRVTDCYNTLINACNNGQYHHLFQNVYFDY